MINKIRKSLPEYGLLALVIAAFVLGGSARADVTSLVLLRPLAVLALAIAILALPREQWAANRALLACAFAWLALTALHLLPLPPAIWQSLPGRELAVQIDAAAGIEGAWRPLSLVPWRTLNALFALALPLAALLLSLRLPEAKVAPIVYLLLALVLASAVIGLLQIIGGPGNAFYTYRVTNADSAVGLFANRNHNAMFLAIGYPLLAASLSLLPTAEEHVRTREWAGAGAGVLLLPFLLTTQSRAGIVLGVVGIVLAWWIYHSPTARAQKRRPRRAIDPRVAFGAFAGAGIVALTMVFTATNAIERLGRLSNADDELRLQVWPPIAEMIGSYFPWGSGIGTFVEVYKAGEPDAQIGPLYLNHAHNDWLEIVLEGGLPFGLLLIVAAILAIRMGARGLRRAASAQEKVLRKLGVSICIILGISSLYDYPLRTPSLALLFAFGLALWAGRLPTGARR